MNFTVVSPVIPVVDCTRTRAASNEFEKSDIFLVQSVHDRKPDDSAIALIDLTGVDRIAFNTCPNTTDKYNIPYGSLVHEAGHALGVGGGRDGVLQEKHHPNVHIKSAIMSYGPGEPQCSPHPLDIMAIFAIYQKQ